MLAAAAGAVVLTIAAWLQVNQKGAGQLIPLLVCLPVVVLRRWPPAVLGVVTAAAGVVTATGKASLPFGVLLGLALYFSVLSLPRVQVDRARRGCCGGAGRGGGVLGVRGRDRAGPGRGRGYFRAAGWSVVYRG
jgi:hypothetical protein